MTASPARRKRVSIKPEEEAKIRTQVSQFDKRRVHYLRCGRMDQGSIERMPLHLYKSLFQRSRDEIEQRFMKQAKPTSHETSTETKTAASHSRMKALTAPSLYNHQKSRKSQKTNLRRTLESSHPGRSKARNGPAFL